MQGGARDAKKIQVQLPCWVVVLNLWQKCGGGSWSQSKIPLVVACALDYFQCVALVGFVGLLPPGLSGRSLHEA